jgi:hypothetical protein
LLLDANNNAAFGLFDPSRYNPYSTFILGRDFKVVSLIIRKKDSQCFFKPLRALAVSLALTDRVDPSLWLKVATNK